MDILRCHSAIGRLHSVWQTMDEARDKVDRMLGVPPAMQPRAPGRDATLQALARKPIEQQHEVLEELKRQADTGTRGVQDIQAGVIQEATSRGPAIHIEAVPLKDSFKRFPLIMHPYDTVASVWAKIQAAEGRPIPSGWRLLSPDGECMGDWQTLADHNVEDGDVLFVAPVQQGGMFHYTSGRYGFSVSAGIPGGEPVEKANKRIERAEDLLIRMGVTPTQETVEYALENYDRLTIAEKLPYSGELVGTWASHGGVLEVASSLADSIEHMATASDTLVRLLPHAS
mmetsp:Transcript_6832/g.16602  ORF Transcript_6832/g.16602 Transcript_6832/m.16602 type:complete len:285 (-) Transcript_6832:225-1079(-)